MVLTRDDREQALDEAIEAASDALDAWTDDEDERSRLWVLFAGGAFVEAFISADDAVRASIAERLNAHIEALGWKLGAS